MKVFGPWCVAVAAALACSAASGQLRAADRVPLDHDGRVRYDGDDLVEAHVESTAELEVLESLAVTIWDDRPGVGTVLAQLDEGVRSRLAALGIEHRLIHDDVQTLIDAEWDANRLAQQQRGGSWHNSYHQYNDIVTHFDELAAAYPALAARESAGTSLEGRDLPAIRITGPGDASGRPLILISACQHAREWISPAVATYITERLLEDYGSDQRVTDLLDAAEVVIIPVANPDGYVYTWTSQRLWRKNRRGGYGVDLNRNWAQGWGGEGSSGNTNNETYRGAGPFSEPETSAIRDYALGFGDRLVASIDFHSFSQLILWPWGYDYIDPPEPDHTRFETVGTGIRDAMLSVGGVPYTAEPSYDLYLASGNAPDWFYANIGSLSFTIELRDTGNFGFELPPSQILPTVTENWAGFMYFAEQATRPLSITVDGGPPAFVGASEGSTVDVTIADGASTYVPGSGMLHAGTGGGAYTDIPLTALGGGTYRAQFPSFLCGADVSYYFTAEAASGATVSLPSGGAAAPFDATALETSVAFADDMEGGTNGWTAGVPGDDATTGQWERANPQGTSAQPEDDHTAAGVNCWITGASSGGSVGANDIDNGTTTLVSPRLDASAAAADGLDAYLVYYRWYSNDQGAAPNADSMPVEVSNDDGATWTQLELVSENLNRWERRAFNLADFVTPTDAIRVRFRARDASDGSIVEAGVDDLAIEIRGCPCAPADLNCDGTLDFFDVQEFLELFAAHDPAADLNNDGAFNFFDVQEYLELFANG
jgi:hypothetical protein